MEKGKIDTLQIKLLSNVSTLVMYTSVNFHPKKKNAISVAEKSYKTFPSRLNWIRRLGQFQSNLRLEYSRVFHPRPFLQEEILFFERHMALPFLFYMLI